MQEKHAPLKPDIDTSPETQTPDLPDASQLVDMHDIPLKEMETI